MKIINHRLEGEGIKIIGSPNRNGLLEPDVIVIHYTAGPDLESTIQTFTDQTQRVSAHLVIDRNGTLVQMVPFDVIAWHAGESSFGDRVGLNKYSIGIEIVNAGRLTKSGDVYLAWFGKEYQEAEVMTGIHRNESVPSYWHRYTEKQIAVARKVCMLLVQTYQIQYILGHEEISPGRKIDPGPAFPLDKFRDKILHPNRDQDEPAKEISPIYGMVTPEKLNIRSEPVFGDNRVANPLMKDQKVKITEASDEWYKVAVEIEGWVLKEHINTSV